MAMEHLADVMGGKDKKPTKKIKHIVHRRTANGGHVFEHHHTAPEHPMEEHAYQDDDGAVDHFIQHGTDVNEGEEQAEGGTGSPMEEKAEGEMQ